MKEYKSTYQNEVAKWTLTLFGHTDTLETQIPKFHEEVQEAKDELYATEPNHEAVAEELIDVVIASLGILHAAGIDFEDVFYKKLNNNYEKYQNVPLYIAAGMDKATAMDKAKSEWNTQPKTGIDYSLLLQ